MKLLNFDFEIMKPNDKKYLLDLRNTEFPTSWTKLFHPSNHTLDSIKAELNLLQEGVPVVVKPSVSASGRSTHLVRNPKNLSSKDEACISDRLFSESIGPVMVQQFKEGISNGEYSVGYIDA